MTDDREGVGENRHAAVDDPAEASVAEAMYGEHKERLPEAAATQGAASAEQQAAVRQPEQGSDPLAEGEAHPS